MQKIVSFIIVAIAFLCCTQATSAQQRNKIAEGVYITTYGNVSVIENDNTQQTVRIKVVKSENLYDIVCGDTVVKTVAKEAIKQGLASVISSYTAIPGWISRAMVGRVVDKIYDGVCNYYR